MDRILLGHGSGGKLMHRLISEHFAPSFGLCGFGDSAVLDLNPQRLAFTTDSYVVSPLFFPGGNIGDLAVNGTVNDLAVSGAQPLFLTAGFIIEEGFPIKDLEVIVLSMADAARRAEVKIVAGDTKVVNRGKGDGIFINTSGIGLLPPGIEISAKKIQPGDAVLVSGEIGSHGVSVLSERNGISFSPPVLSDTVALNGLVKRMLSLTKEVRFMRDPTRGGLATTLKEAALESGLCIRIKESFLPIASPIQGACDLLGLDPLYVANEGMLVAVVSRKDADALAAGMQQHPAGARTRIIGEVSESPQEMVLLETSVGGTRVLDMLQGEHLPRIC